MASKNRHTQLEVHLESAEQVQHGALFLDSEGNILSVNRRFLRGLDYAREQFEPKTIFQINPHFNFLTWKKWWQELLEKRHMDFETEHLNAQLELTPVRLKCLLVEADGRQYCQVNVEGEREKEEGEDLYLARFCLDNANEMITWVNPDGSIFYVNKATREVLGYSSEELFSMKIYDLEPGYDKKDWEAHWEEIRACKWIERETVRRAKSGEIIPVILSIHYMNYNGREYKIAFMRDLRQHQRREEIVTLSFHALDQSAEMVYWLEPDGSFYYFNDTFFKKTGYEEIELVGKTLFDITPDLTEEEFQAKWDTLRSQKIIHTERDLLCKDGLKISVEETMTLVKLGKQEYSCTTIRDISEQKQMGKSLALSYHALENSIQMIYWLNPEGRFVYANRAVREKLGYSLDELKKINLWEVEPDMTPEMWQQRWQELKSLGSLEKETLRKSRNGEIFPVKLYINHLEFEGEEYNVAIVSDLRSRKKLEENTKLSFVTINQSSDIIFWLNPDGGFHYFNDRLPKVTGYKRKEINNMQVLDFFPDSSMKEFLDGWKSLQKGETLTSERQITCRDGKKIWVETTVNMVDFEGRQYSATTLKDITERREKEKQIKEQLEKIEQLRKQLQEENIVLKEEIKMVQGPANIISGSPNYKPVLRQIGQVADTDATVLILGETGTGKELVANAIYQLSGRSEKPLVKVNCGALPENLIESELFGHEKGAFTGAFQRKIGRFEMAHRGTIFLDEIGELPLDLQAKLLRVLQEGEFERLGGTQTIKVDVRVIAATNRNLEELAEKGKFREDLFYRLNVFPINNIPLRERKEDIPLLVRHFIEKYNHRLGRRIEEVPPSVMKNLMEYEYPGNVRELENLIERAIILSPSNKLVGNFQFKTNKRGEKRTFHSMQEMQRRHILEALRRCKGKVTGPGGAAELLKMKDKTLYSRMTKLRIGRNDYL